MITSLFQRIYSTSAQSVMTWTCSLASEHALSSCADSAAWAAALLLCVRETWDPYLILPFLPSLPPPSLT